MQRLQVMLFLLLAGLVTSGCASVSAMEGHGGLYFLDGIDRQDGMSASIDFTTRTMRVAGDGFELRGCLEGGPSVKCIDSNYFMLSLKEAVAGRWSERGVDFEVIESCSISSPRGLVSTSVVSSAQKHGAFEFYIGPKYELLGWTLRHSAGKDLYLKRGLRLDACE